MPLMGSLYIGSSGLQTSQNALNTTAHNLSNVDTTGYTRQQVQQSNRAYVTLSTEYTYAESAAEEKTGLGVTYSRVNRSEIISWTKHTARNPDAVCSMKCLRKSWKK